MKQTIINLLLTITLLALNACSAPPAPAASGQALAVESFLADIAQNIAGNRITVQTLIPLGLDPHAFEPTPQDVVKLTSTKILILNGAGFEEWLEPVLPESPAGQLRIEAAAGLTPRQTDHKNEAQGQTDHPHELGDPHFWLDPISTITYVENIRDGLIAADPAGKETYTQNAEAYIRQLQELDAWIKTQVETIPPENRLLVTNHESLGYFADRYGFTIIGTVVPSVTSGSSPSAQELAELINQIKTNNVQAVFLETGSNPQLAQQISSETGVKVVSDIYTHSITDKNGPASTYILMMKTNVTAIVEALR
ncbi:MAG TPA: metal ABC transporter substrate-binding protein [Anaerolineaceae bacterium]|nr:metal ABC transporter substrate-binding protein [Anaerolineaceae bacterium]HPN50277.1 metal ABC transporter substrate-binding protein [Anaerolineaceae bacterium]